MNDASNDEIYTDETLAAYLKVAITTPEANKKKFYRLRALDPEHPRHLKSFPVGGEPRYRKSDVDEWIARNTRNFLLWLAEGDFDEDDFDPAVGTGKTLDYP